MKTIFFYFLTPLLLVSASFPRDVYVDERTSTEVHFSSTENVFPRNWYGQKIKAEARPLEKSERQRVILILNHAFEKYPGHVLRTNLDRIYVFKSMQFYGVPYGGTNFRNTVYLTDDESRPSFTDIFIEGVFHHEFSSILKRSYPRYFDEKKWNAINSSQVKYGNGGVDAILNGEASLTLDPGLFEQGFLTKYSQSALEEDVNVFAQNLFTGGMEFWSIVDQYSRIRQKANLLIGFYHQIDSTFTEDYFRGLGFRFASR